MEKYSSPLPPAPPSVGTACLPVGRGEGWDGELRNTACFISKYRLDLIYSEAFPGETTKVIQTQLICCHSQFEVPKQVRNDIPFLVMLNSLQHLLYCVCISFATGFCDWQVSIGSHRSPMVERRWTGKEKGGGRGIECDPGRMSKMKTRLKLRGRATDPRWEGRERV